MNKNIKNNKEGGFITFIIIVIVALLLMRYFGITISGTMAHFGLTWTGILDWFKDLVNAVK